MNAQQTVRLLVPAGLFIVLVSSPRTPAVNAGQNAPAPVLNVPNQPVPDVPLDQLYHEIAPKGAKVTVVEFSDFGCPYCGRFERDEFPVLRKEFVETGKVRWRFVPFVLGIFPNGSEAMRSATCVAEQGEADFWKMHDQLFAHQDEWKSARSPEPIFQRYAVASGADAKKFAACYASTRAQDRETAADALADRSGVHSTPTFFVNGRMVEGALPLAQFRAILEQLTG